MAAATTGIWNTHHAANPLSQLTGNHLAALPGGSSASGIAPSASSIVSQTTGVNSQDTSTSSSSSANASGISSNDFLTLLVTEMQNQDPTAATDPNEYINQLVQINSLEQLIDINQNLATVLGAASGIANSGSGSSSVTPASGTTATAASNALSQVQGAVPGADPSLARPGASGAAHSSSPFPTTSGNLSVPDATPASLQVAQALSGKPHNHSFTGRSTLPR